MNLCDYDYPKETYDVVISNLVLHYIEDLSTIYQKVYETFKSMEPLFLILNRLIQVGFQIEHIEETMPKEEMRELEG